MSRSVDYDRIAAEYDNRYAQSDYSGVQRALAEFVLRGGRPHRQPVLEVGCGTGHWLTFLDDADVRAVGLDPSTRMLSVAREHRRDHLLVRACAEKLPLASARFGRIVCINALHHFGDQAMFFAEARRVLRSDGAVMTVGLDPHVGTDQWWIYDYFPEALVADRRRYRSAKDIRTLMEAAGFSRCETVEIQHLPRQLTVDEAVRAGFLKRTHTSQLMVISQEEYEAGLNRIHAVGADAPGERILRADLRLYSTRGWAA